MLSSRTSWSPANWKGQVVTLPEAREKESWPASTEYTPLSRMLIKKTRTRASYVQSHSNENRVEPGPSWPGRELFHVPGSLGSTAHDAGASTGGEVRDETQALTKKQRAELRRTSGSDEREMSLNP